MIVGIVGSEAAKFTKSGEERARTEIRALLSRRDVTGYCSGHCHLGGIDIWTEEIGNELNLLPHIFPPKFLDWSRGYRPRNVKIAETSTEVHCITVDHLPNDYSGMRFEFCYHCKTKEHIKSGGCWTAIYAKKLGKPVFWTVIHND